MEGKIGIFTECLSWFSHRMRKKTVTVWSCDLRGFALGFFHFLSEARGIWLLAIHPSSQNCPCTLPKKSVSGLSRPHRAVLLPRQGKEGKAEFLFTEDLSETFCLVTTWKCHMEGKETGGMESQRRKVNKHGPSASLENLEMHGKLRWHFPGLGRVRNYTEASNMCGCCYVVLIVKVSCATHCDFWRIIFSYTVIWPCSKPRCSTILDNILANQNTHNPVNNKLFRTYRRMISKS